MVRWAIGGVILVSLQAGCASYQARAIGGPLDTSAAKITARDYPGASVVFLEELADVRFDDARDPALGVTYNGRVRFKILSLAGRERARFTIPVDDLTSLRSVAARTYASDGTESPVELTRVERPVAFASSDATAAPYYTDRRLAMFDVPGAGVGDIVELEFMIHSRGLSSMPGWYFQSTEPILLSRYTLHLPPDWTLDHATHVEGQRIEAPPVCTAAKRGTVCAFEARDQPALPAEHRGLPFTARARMLSVSARAPGQPERASWDEVGALYRALLASVAPLSAADQQAVLAEAQRAAGASIEERLFAWVRDNIRYAAVFRGLGGVRPHAPGQTRSRGWGDCKDMATLLVALLREQGLRAWPALISASRELPTDTIPRLGVFNHAIVAVETEDGVHFLDPTDKLTPYGALGLHLRGKRALIVRDQDVEFLTVPWTYDVDRLAIEWTVSATGTVALAVEGYGLHASRLLAVASRPRHEQLHWARSMLAREGGAEATDVQIVARADGRTSARATLRVPESWVESEREVLGVLGVYLSMGHEVASRDSPVALGLPGVTEERVHWLAPPGARWVESPRASAWESAALSAKLTVESTAQGLLITRTQARREAWLGPERSGELNGFERVLHDAAQEVVVWAR